MDDPVHDGIRLCPSSEPSMPFVYRILSDKDGGIISAALFKQFIEVLGIFFRKFVIQPFIKDKDLIVANPFLYFVSSLRLSLWFSKLRIRSGIRIYKTL